MSATDKTAPDHKALMVASIKGRAMVYKAMLDELRESLGEEQAIALMRGAIERRGREIGKQFQTFAPGDFAGLRDAFIAYIPDAALTVDPDVRKCDADGLEIKFRRCPLKTAWIDAGLPDPEVETLCAIAGCVDTGTFTEAGFAIDVETWKQGEEGCCRLVITRAP
ncbi:MAG: L-2-amino-thiazoline-4-carboxylic acid hydrolase [Rhodospirillum sp.]|nr:L-2-amino-thiazoline-4-carboxylic acid hydrolase [Rhodospirillum sp.]MCF8489389.1 L-2-amino-thiazoline-4-carboxylic acid hydrolase [Rhodospirillum sp.]MCF8500883.1 L-2-amino-thiazoline-4-carboxylic acid hydrolase [Rhodospirillum sp.]